MEFATDSPFFATARSLAGGGIRLFEVAGRMAGSQQEYQLLDEVRKNLVEGHTNFVFDFSQLTYANSCGIGVLISCVTSIRQASCQAAVVNVPQRERDVLQICSFFVLCDEYDSLDDLMSDVDFV